MFYMTLNVEEDLKYRRLETYLHGIGIGVTLPMTWI